MTLTRISKTTLSAWLIALYMSLVCAPYAYAQSGSNPSTGDSKIAETCDCPDSGESCSRGGSFRFVFECGKTLYNNVQTPQSILRAGANQGRFGNRQIRSPEEVYSKAFNQSGRSAVSLTLSIVNYEGMLERGMLKFSGRGGEVIFDDSEHIRQVKTITHFTDVSDFDENGESGFILRKWSLDNVTSLSKLGKYYVIPTETPVIEVKFRRLPSSYLDLNYDEVWGYPPGDEVIPYEFHSRFKYIKYQFLMTETVHEGVMNAEEGGAVVSRSETMHYRQFDGLGVSPILGHNTLGGSQNSVSGPRSAPRKNSVSIKTYQGLDTTGALVRSESLNYDVYFLEEQTHDFLIEGHVYDGGYTLTRRIYEAHTQGATVIQDLGGTDSLMSLVHEAEEKYVFDQPVNLNDVYVNINFLLDQLVTTSYHWDNSIYIPIIEGRLIQETKKAISSSQDKVTIYEYIKDGNELTNGRIESKSYPGGRRELFTYNDNPNTSISSRSVVSPWKDRNPSAIDDTGIKGEQSIYTANQMREITRIDHRIVSSRTREFDGQDGMRVITSREQDPSGGELIEKTAYHLTHYSGSGLLQAFKAGRMAWKINRDGTFTTCEYQQDGPNFVETHKTGKGSTTAITAGIETKKTYTPAEIQIKEEVRDIKTGYLIRSWEASMLDMTGRPTKIVHNGDPNDYEQKVYSCCGLSYVRDRDGMKTHYTRDPLRRVTVKRMEFDDPTRPDVEERTTYEGLTTTVRRVSAGFDILVSKTVRDLNGDVIERWSPDADGDGVDELTTYSYGSYGLPKVITQTNPDGSTVITQYYLDGSIKSRTGTAVPDMSYDKSVTTAVLGNTLYGITQTVSRPATSGVAATETVETVTDALGREHTRTYADGASMSSTYYDSTASAGSRGKLETRIDLDGITTTYTYDAEGELIKESRPGTGTNSPLDTRYSYRYRSLLSYGGVFRYIIARPYDRYPTVNYDATDGFTRTVRTERGLTKIVTDRGTLGDQKYRTIQTSPEGVMSVNYYADTRLLASTIWEAGSTPPVDPPLDIQAVSTVGFVSGSSYIYDALGRMTSSKDSRTGVTSYGAYHPAGTLSSVTTPAGHMTSYTYDSMGRVITVDQEDTYTHNPASNSPSPITNTTHTSYYPTGQVKATWGDQTYPRFYVYDEQNRMTDLHTWQTAPALTQMTNTPPSGSAVTTWSYDPQRGWLNNKRYHNSVSANRKGPDYTYTPAGRLKTREWARTMPGETARVKTTYGYDQGFLTSVTYDHDNGNTPDLSYTYDSHGRLATVSRNGALHASYAYAGNRSQVVQETLNQDSDAHILKRYYDTYRRPVSVTLEKSGSSDIVHSYGYAYDSVSRLEKVWHEPTLNETTKAPEGSANFTYAYQSKSYGLIQSVTGPIHTVSNTWEANRNVLDIKRNHDLAGTTTFSQYDYSVNAIGQRTQVSQSGTAFDYGAATNTTHAVNWSYDAFGQVTKEDHSDNSRDNAYAFDAIGNRQKDVHGGLTLPVAANYSVDDLNQYTALPQTTNPSHDDDGNSLSTQVPGKSASNLPDGTSLSNMVWDAENRLVSADTGEGVTVSYEYDYLGRQTKSVGSLTISHIYDGWNPITYGNSVSSTTCTYTWGLDLSGSMQGAGGVGGLLVTDHVNFDVYPLYDGNGNACQYYGELPSGGLGYVARWEYDSFGRTVKKSTDIWSDAILHRFSTKMQDIHGSGLYYYGYRYYNPTTGRWPSRDPIVENGGFNLYGFVDNRAFSRIDILGKQGWETVYDPGDALGDNPNSYSPDPNPMDRPFAPFDGLNPNIPLVGGPEAGADLGRNEYYNAYHADKVAEYKRKMTNRIKIAIKDNCGGTISDSDIQGETFQTADIHNNLPQWFLSANLRAGKVTAKVENLEINYTAINGNNANEFTWTADLIFSNTLGLGKNDEINWQHNFVGKEGIPIFPDRQVVEARWGLSGDGCCYTYVN